MKLKNTFSIDYRSASVVQLPVKGMSRMEMLLPGACTSTVASCSCSCGAVVKK